MREKRDTPDKCYLVYVVLVTALCFFRYSNGNQYGGEVQTGLTKESCKFGNWLPWGDTDCQTQSVTRTRNLLHGNQHECLQVGKLQETKHVSIPTPIISTWSEWGKADKDGISRRSRTTKGLCAIETLGQNFPLEETRIESASFNTSLFQEKDSKIIGNIQHVSQPKKELKIEPFVPIKLDLTENKGQGVSPQNINLSDIEKKSVDQVNSKNDTIPTNGNESGEPLQMVSKISEVHIKDDTEKTALSTKHDYKNIKYHDENKIVQSKSKNGMGTYKKLMILQAKPLDYYYKIPSYRIYTEPLAHILKGEYHKSAIMNENNEVITTTPEPTTIKPFWEEGGFLDFRDEHNKWYRDHIAELRADQPDTYGADGSFDINMQPQGGSFELPVSSGGAYGSGPSDTYGSNVPSYGESYDGTSVNQPYGSSLPNKANGSSLPNSAYGSALPNEAYGSALPNSAYGSALPNEAYGSALPNEAYGSHIPSGQSYGSNYVNPLSIQPHGNVQSIKSHGSNVPLSGISYGSSLPSGSYDLSGGSYGNNPANPPFGVSDSSNLRPIESYQSQSNIGSFGKPPLVSSGVNKNTGANYDNPAGAFVNVLGTYQSGNGDAIGSGIGSYGGYQPAPVPPGPGGPGHLQTETERSFVRNQELSGGQYSGNSVGSGGSYGYMQTNYNSMSASGNGGQSVSDLSAGGSYGAIANIPVQSPVIAGGSYSSNSQASSGSYGNNPSPNDVQNSNQSSNKVNNAVSTEYTNDRKGRVEYLKTKKDFSDIFSILANSDDLSEKNFPSHHSVMTNNTHSPLYNSIVNTNY